METALVVVAVEVKLVAAAFVVVYCVVTAVVSVSDMVEAVELVLNLVAKLFWVKAVEEHEEEEEHEAQE